MTPRVLISDSLSETAVDVFRERGVDVDFQPKLGADKEQLAAIVGDYRRPRHPLGDEGHAEGHRRGERAAQGDRPRRHRRRQCRYRRRRRPPASS